MQAWFPTGEPIHGHGSSPPTSLLTGFSEWGLSHVSHRWNSSPQMWDCAVWKPLPLSVHQPPPRHQSFLLGCPSLPLLLVWMNVSSLTPWLSDFHTAQFSLSSGCFLFLNLLSFFWLWGRHSVSTYASILARSLFCLTYCSNLSSPGVFILFLYFPLPLFLVSCNVCQLMSTMIVLKTYPQFNIVILWNRFWNLCFFILYQNSHYCTTFLFHSCIFCVCLQQWIICHFSVKN